ncbi:MAG: amidohydrolase [Tissierellales bacterium]|nr:amidohydrolase [Tissierellales bacterium]
MYYSGELLKNHITNLRRKIHKNPELGGEEQATAELIVCELERLGINYRSKIGGYGVLGIIKGAYDGPIVALRADIDALPIQEKNNSEYKSEVNNKMHACGHDAHTAMVIGAAHYLLSKVSELKGTVLLIFQPSEEVAPTGGAQKMMDDGLFSEFSPDIIFAQHVWPQLPVGKIGIRSGIIMGSSDKFEIIIKGKGGHASAPHQGNDTIVCVGQLISAFQSIVSRNLDPHEIAVITIGTVNAGSRYNILAEEARMSGTVRTLDPIIREYIKDRIKTISENIAKAMDMSIELEYIQGYPATINNHHAVRFTRQISNEMFGAEFCVEIEPQLTAEDFSVFLKKYPGCYFLLGTGKNEKNDAPLHDPYFDIDEQALEIGYILLGQLALSYGNNLDLRE